MRESSHPAYDPTPEAYLKVGLMPQPTPALLSELGNNIAQRFVGASDTEVREAICSDDERTALEGILRFIDHCLPQKVDEYRVRAKYRNIRLSRSIGQNLLEFNLPDLDINDLTQEARLAALYRLRRHDPGRSKSVLTFMPLVIASNLVHKAIDSISRGTRGQGGQLGPEHEGFGSLKTRKQIALARSSEGGYSDALTTVYQHPNFIHHEPLLFEPEEPYDDYAARFLPQDDQPIAPITDRADQRVAGMFNEAETSHDLSRVFAVSDQWLQRPLTEKQKLILKLRYEEDMTFEEIASIIGYSRQNAEQLHATVMKRLKSSPMVMRLLYELPTF